MNDRQDIATNRQARALFYHGLFLGTSPDVVAANLHAVYAEHFFGGQLAFIDIEVDRYPFDGCYSWDNGDGARRRIRLNVDLFDCGYEDVREVLVHEMCHQYVREVCLDWSPEESHGALFNEIADRVGVATRADAALGSPK